MPDSIVIVAARRTPIGAFQGGLTPLSAPQLASAAIRGAFSGLGELGREVDEAVFGCCLMAGLKQAPARQAVLGAGLPDSVPATTLTKMCGSGMKATMLVHDMLLAGSANYEFQILRNALIRDKTIDVSCWLQSADPMQPPAIDPNFWYPLARSRDLKAGKMLAVRFAGEPIVLARTRSGQLLALEDRCAHRQVPLHVGVPVP